MPLRPLCTGLVLTALILVVAANLAPLNVTQAMPWGWQVQRLRLDHWTAEAEAVAPVVAAGRCRVVAEGRVAAYPGAQVTVSSEVAGKLVELPVQELAVVHKGDRLARLDDSEQRAALAEARARLAEVEADNRLATWKLKRARELIESGAASNVEVQQYTRDVEVAEAQRQTLLASIQRLQTVVSKSSVVAPIDGTVVARPANAGEMVAAAQPLLTIADLSRTRIEAEVDEFDAGRVMTGAEVL